MTTKRIYIGTDRVTVSKPGYDAESPPALDYRYLALDSRMNTGRPLEAAFIPSITIGLTVNLTQTYAGVPAIDLIILRNNVSYYSYYSPLVMRDGDSPAINRTPFVLRTYTNRFQILEDRLAESSIFVNGSYSGYYIAWQNW